MDGGCKREAIPAVLFEEPDADDRKRERRYPFFVIRPSESPGLHGGKPGQIADALPLGSCCGGEETGRCSPKVSGNG